MCLMDRRPSVNYIFFLILTIPYFKSTAQFRVFAEHLMTWMLKPNSKPPCFLSIYSSNILSTNKLSMITTQQPRFSNTRKELSMACIFIKPQNSSQKASKWGSLSFFSTAVPFGGLVQLSIPYWFISTTIRLRHWTAGSRHSLALNCRVPTFPARSNFQDYSVHELFSLNLFLLSSWKRFSLSVNSELLHISTCYSSLFLRL